MKKYIVALGILPLFFWISLGYDCSNLDSDYKYLNRKMDDRHYRSAILDAKINGITTMSEWNYYAGQADAMREEAYDHQDLSYDYENHARRCDQQIDDYNDYVQRWIELEKTLTSYDHNKITQIIKYYKQAVSIATNSNAIPSKNVNAVRDAIAKREDEDFNQQEKLEAEKKAKEKAEAEAKAKKEAEDKLVADILAAADFEDSKAYLGVKTAILDSIIKTARTKDKKIQEKFIKTVNSFKNSKDDYTRYIGIYISYLWEN